MGPDSMGTVGGVYTINYFYDEKRADTMCFCGAATHLLDAANAVARRAMLIVGQREGLMVL